MTEVKTYKDLIVWKKSIHLVKEVYALMKDLPQEEKFGLTSQIKRSSISIPSNIAEGWGRYSPKDYVRFLRIARGSLFELETQLILVRELGFSNNGETITSILEEVSKMLIGLINSLKQKHDLI